MSLGRWIAETTRFGSSTTVLDGEPCSVYFSSKVRGRGMCGTNCIFLRDDLKDKRRFERFFEDWFDPHSDSAIQPKARGLLHMKPEYIAHHIKEDVELEHLIASMQSRNYLEDYSKHTWIFETAWWSPELVKVLEERLQKYSTPTKLDYEELGGLLDPGQRNCSHAWNILE